jgi:tagatose 1,6-diphosphate aldolase
MKTSFQFLRPGKLINRDLELVLTRTVEADPIKRHVPMYEFDLRHISRRVAMGKIRLRIGSALALRYPGHIGYEVRQRFRGRRYAARSCQLLLPLAHAHGLKAVWLTVDPKNIPSQKTCQIVGARYIETVSIPRNHEMYQDGARYRRRYKLDLDKMQPSNQRSQPGTLLMPFFLVRPARAS